jgi:DNA-binding transcriptional MerR regulator
MKNYKNKFNEQKFIARETGVSRRNLSVWYEQGLLLHREEKLDGWKKYSMYECVWILIVNQLKKSGVKNKQIQQVKSILDEDVLISVWIEHSKKYLVVYERESKFLSELEPIASHFVCIQLNEIIADFYNNKRLRIDYDFEILNEFEQSIVNGINNNEIIELSIHNDGSIFKYYFKKNNKEMLLNNLYKLFKIGEYDNITIIKNESISNNTSV